MKKYVKKQLSIIKFIKTAYHTVYEIVCFFKKTKNFKNIKPIMNLNFR